MANSMKHFYGNRQKEYLEDRIQVYERAGIWDCNNEPCWRLLTLDMERDLDLKIVIRARDVNGEPNESYAKRCVKNWRFWEIDKYIKRPKAA